MPKSQGKISLDELLKAKRLERPPREFWTRFDKELKLKERRLLQQQPLEDCELGVDSWPRWKRAMALACATVSSGVFGMILLNSLSPSLTSADLDAPEDPTSVFEVAQPYQASSPQPDFAETRLRTKPAEFVEMEHDARLENELATSVDKPTALSAAEPVYATVEVETSNDFAAPIPEESFPLTTDTPFADFSMKTATASSAFDYSSRLLSRYQHPLKDKGYAYGYEHLDLTRKNPLDRLTTMAIEANLFEADSRWGLKLDTVSLKF